MKKNVIVVGAGASGLMCSIVLARKGHDVTILEKDSKAGKKILASGNGRCNLTNTGNFNKAYNQNLKRYFEKFDTKKAILFFEQLGLLTYADNEGRVYPISNLSSAVLDVLLNEINKLKIKILYNQDVKKITKKNNKFVIKTSENLYECDNVVFSAGGNFACDILCDLGVNIKPFIPSLVGLKTSEIGDVNGIRQHNVLASLVLNKKEYSEKGEVLFKNNGVSGIVIFNLSTILARENSFNAQLNLNLLPDYSKENLVQILSERCSKKIYIKDLLTGIFHKKLNFVILKKAGINNLEQDCKNLSKNNILSIVNCIQKFSLNVNGFFDNNQVHSGGVSLLDLNINLECKGAEGLYITGEACDVDGVCGGYNLLWAWTSGFIAGDSI